MNEDIDATLVAVFEERAENLSRDELWSWSAETDRDRVLLRKLRGPGSKLLSGPRGSGKSTLLRKAYFSLLDSNSVLPAYINFSRSLALEPLLHTQANALQLFRQWVVHMIIIGLADGLRDGNKEIPHSLAIVVEHGKKFISDLETGKTTGLPQRSISPTELLRLIEQWTSDVALTRCILLMDDAAHAFSPTQQRDFFEVFRALRSRYVAAKAAVYPGITSYSPYFHVGHEAELLEAWYAPDDESYLATMRSIAETRLPSSLFSRFGNREELLDYLALASFGLPRGYLNMLSFVLGVEDDPNIKPTRRQAESAVRAHAESVRNVFRALKKQLPRYKHFIDIGLRLERSIANTLRSYNAGKVAGPHKTPTIAISDPISPELDRVLSMAEYAGVLRGHGTVSRGVKGVFHRYSLHFAIVLVENSLSLGRSFSVSDIIRSLSVTNAHAFARSRDTQLLGRDYQQDCTLDLAPCQKCGSARPSEDAKFCISCGAELKNVSIYEELIHSPIENLPLTQHKLDGLRQHTTIRTVQDILLDEESREVRKAPYVGAVWAARIRNAAQEYVSV